MHPSRTTAAGAVDRRRFLKTGAAAIVGTTVVGARDAACEQPARAPDPIAARPFGKTGRKLPMLAYGGAGLPKMWGNPLSTEDRVKLVRYAYERGIRYFDTASNYDQCMLSYGYLPRGHEQVYSARMVELRNACVAKAHELGMGIAAMKVIGAGVLGAWSGYAVPDFDKARLQQLPAAAIRYVLSDDRIDLLVIGMRLQEEVDANIKTLAGDTAYTLDDRALLAEFGVRAFEAEAVKAMRVD